MKSYHFEETLPKHKGLLDVLVETGSVKIVPHKETAVHDKTACPHGGAGAVIIDAVARHMEISVVHEGNKVIIRVKKDKSWRNWDQKLTRWLKNDHPKAELTIQVPEDCEINATTVTGKLSINDLNAPVTTRVVTGTTQLANLGGPINAKTVTGQLSYNGFLTNEHHCFKATTGNVTLNLSKEPNAHLDAKTVTGRIRCDYPLAKMSENGSRTSVGTSRFTGSRLTGILGSGEGHIKARVVTGNLRLKSA